MLQPRPRKLARRLPVGAELLPEGTHFRVWAPASKSVSVVLEPGPAKPRLEFPLVPELNGYFSGQIAEAQAGTRYKYKLGSGVFPDPASRFQPEGPHGPSEVVNPAKFQWSDERWTGCGDRGQVIYEMHIGTFTPEGTWAAAQEQLQELARLGITLLEVMPVSDFAGTFGWGYDGVNLYAPTRLYGQPDDFRLFVDSAHALGLGVILDVVYNHTGPEGNYLKEFSTDYFTDRYKNEWGEALNFDGPNCGPVREFFIANAGYWIDEYHLDGLRLDATQQIYDASEEHLLCELGCRAREAAGKRSVFLVAENEPQHATMVRRCSKGGHGLDALWNDDLHHSSMAALTGRSEAYYSDYRGTPQEFVSSLKHGPLYQGQWYAWQKQRRGLPAGDVEPHRHVCFLQNHDQVANSLRGLRIHQMAAPGSLRAITTLFLLGPGTPMLFQGQEFGASSPFLFFADHGPELARLVARGRKDFSMQFPAMAGLQDSEWFNEPSARATFERCKLDFSERQKHAELYRMHRDLLKLRREDPVFANPRPGGLDGAVLSGEAFVIRFFGEDHGDRLLLINLGLDLPLTPAPEPLLAPPYGKTWEILWSSEHPIYGGCGTPELQLDTNWKLLGHSALVLKSVEQT